MKNIQNSNFMKIRPVEVELFHAGGRTGEETDMRKVIITFRNFANAPKITILFNGENETSIFRTKHVQ